ncbi:LPXTG cell wall anchor domain-containing protein [Streptomyces sp. NPDC014864]|uniref:LPXTG cell wall anchor domain-containing protein n=1 Tax=Streptomyces sp. NPDC014864 TaxID=3364924 RepID=UPI0036FAFE25
MTTTSRWRVALVSAASAAVLAAVPLAAAQTAHAQPPYPPTTGALSISTTTVTRGQTVTFSSSGVFGAGSAVTALLESTPIVLGRFRADANGTVSGTVTVPRRAPLGWHVFRLTSNRPDQSVGTTVYVQDAPSTPPTGTPTPTPTSTHHPRPEPPGRPDHPGGHGPGGGDDGRNPGHPGGHSQGGGDDGRNSGHQGSRSHQASLANTGSTEKALTLGGAAAALLVTGGGTMLAVRRRRNS